VAFLALLLGSAVAASAQTWRAGIDSRVELVSILFRLAGNQEYRQCRVPAYDQAIEKYFAPFRNHDAVQMAHSLAIGFDAPMKLAVKLGDVDSLSEMIPLDRPAKTHDFLAGARKFVGETNFQAFSAIAANRYSPPPTPVSRLLSATMRTSAGSPAFSGLRRRHD
jgi:hypothetical protein